MTRQKIRDEIAAKFRDFPELTIQQIAAEFGVCVTSVSRISKDAGYSRKRGRRLGSRNPNCVPFERYLGADWKKNNTEIAREYEISRERIRQVRKSLGKPQSEMHRKQESGKTLRRWLTEHKSELVGLTALDIQAICGFPVTASSVKSACYDVGIALHARQAMSESMTVENIKNFVKEDANGCWIWTRKKTSIIGYGKIGGKYAHHISFVLFNGEIPEGKWVLHHCDVPACINPAHLYAGTPSNNAQDRLARNRIGKRLSDEEVQKIRSERQLGVSIGLLAKDFGVTAMTIYSIVKNRTHKIDAA